MDTVQILIDLRAQRERVDRAIAAVEALNGTGVLTAKAATKAATPEEPSSKPTPSPVSSAKRVVSREGRQRMAEAQQKRWAKKKRAVKAAARKAAAVAPSAAKPAKAAPATSPIL
jgi:hypothetical protein